MSVTATHDRPALETTAPVMKALLSLNGGALLGAAVGLWLMPGSNLGAEVMVMKLGLSVFLALGGLTLLSCARARRPG